MRSVRFVTGENGLSHGSKLFDAETGAELRGIRRIVVTAEVDNIVTIEAEFIRATTSAQGTLVAMMCNPETGMLQEVAHVRFADGSEWHA